MAEIRKTKELAYLLAKATRQPLDAVEKQKVRDQLLHIVKSIPALIIFSLPGGFFLLILLIKKHPFNISPFNVPTPSDNED